MIEIPVWAFVFAIIALVVVYLLLILMYGLDSPDKESIESISKDLELERSKVRDLRDELELWRFRYKDLNENCRKLLDEKIVLSEKCKELEDKVQDVNCKCFDLRVELRDAREFSKSVLRSKGCQGCCMQQFETGCPVFGNTTHSVDKEERFTKCSECEREEIVKAEWGRPIYINNAGHYTIPCSHCYYSTSVRSKDFRPNFCSNCGAKMTNATVPNEEI